MKNKFLNIFVACFLVIAMAACTQTGNQKEQLGTLGGAVAGGLLGSQVGKGSGQLVAVGIGTLLGAVVGSEVGKSLDKADMAYARQAENRALKNASIGEEIHWNNPETGHRGIVEPVRDGTSQSGKYCREYQHTVIIGGQSEQAYGTACRQPDGSWEIID
ncbi:MAG: hypothetical protein CMP22_04400 [Rickettsiales bacterium]|nr:hypothetical protein [Rickettsiales bacterium]